MQHLTVHLALDSQDPANGAITYIPGSHRWHRDGRPLPITDENFADMDSIKRVLRPEELALFKPVTLTLKRGEAVLHHPLCVHGSYGNRSPRPRRAAVVNYFRAGTLSDSNEPLLAGTPATPQGHPVEGQFHPVVFDPAWIKG
jgi:ectoine hydroxylase-related dioxygenase (phytanoyl-CoA dioxygenase family)